ncbi:hypothetical protein RCL1_005819 [Eukaryota sp. TZLM3-RCL]
MISKFDSPSQESPLSSPIHVSPSVDHLDDDSIPRYLIQQKQEHSQNIARLALQSKTEIARLKSELAESREATKISNQKAFFGS